MSSVSLVPFAPEHFPALTGWFQSQSEVTQWAGSGPTFPLDGQQLREMLKECLAHPPARFCWMAINERGEVIGHTQLAMDWQNGVARLARVAIAPSHRGNAFSIPMLAAVLSQAFLHSEIERVELNVFSWNSPAIQTYFRLGFLHEGTRRSSVQVGSERWDTMLMGLLRHEWERARSAL